MRFILRIVLSILVSSSLLSSSSYAQDEIKHVILISFDGLRPDAIKALGPQKASAFYKMINEGASTLNARNDVDNTVTIPNHTSMITGYPVLGKKGHHVTDNTLVSKKIHEYSGQYIYSIFDVVHEHKGHTAMIASKLKFSIFSKSYPIDFIFLSDKDDQRSLDSFLNLKSQQMPEFVFLHFSNPDTVGHAKGWDIKEQSPYMNKVEELNTFLGKILKSIESNDLLKDSTVVIVTSDHGGEGKDHRENRNIHNYTVPFIIWGKPVAKGVDLYKINKDTRKDPSNRRVGYNEKLQPIRNSDAANLVVSLLGFPKVQGSTVGFDKSLKIN